MPAHQGYLRDVGLGPALLRRAMNLWPPFLGAGIKVTRIAADYRDIEVRLDLRLFNRNYVGTHFGGSLYAMTDPFFMLMMLHNLGPDYVVWDKAGSIEYVKPGRAAVHAHFQLPPAELSRARRATTHGRKYEPTFHVAIVDAKGEVVARVTKTLYVRKKPAAPRAARGAGRRRKAAETP
jgi:acyl-coenzyme A thioesterase PaaI-like protein